MDLNDQFMAVFFLSVCRLLQCPKTKTAKKKRENFKEFIFMILWGRESDNPPTPV